MIPSAMECPIAHQDEGHLAQQQLAEQSSASQSGEPNQPNPPILGEQPHTMNQEPIPEPSNRQGEQVMAQEATIRPIEPDRPSSPTARTRPLVYAIISSKLGDISEHNTRKALTRTKLMRMIDDLSIRAILTVIFGSIWWKQDEIEPEAAYTSLIETLTEGYRCKICSHEKTRWDRALAHIRKHVEHRPFACTGRTCGNDKKCTARFFTKECLAAHQKRDTVICHCGAEIVPKNLSRHQKSLKCRQSQLASPQAQASGEPLNLEITGND